MLLLVCSEECGDTAIHVERMEGETQQRVRVARSDSATHSQTRFFAGHWQIHISHL